jgi:hypothetical protein
LGLQLFVMSASRERPLRQLSRVAATPIENAFYVLQRKQTVLLSFSGILEHDKVNLHLQGSLSTIGARNFRTLVVYAKRQVLGDHLYQRNRWLVFVRPTCTALRSQNLVFCSNQ